MNITRISTMSAIMFGLLFLGPSAEAKVELPAVFSDNMVLQQKTNAAIWGTADAGKTVTVTTSWNQKSYSVNADSEGHFKIKVATPSYGGPYSISLSDGEALTLNNVLIGDVWVCSGQSNMEMPLAGWGKIKNYEEEVKQANYPKIRLLQAVHVTSNVPLDDAKVTNGGWTACTPEYIAEFSSVAYFFAREITQKTGIPIGLIHTSWGGTIAEAWTSGAMLKTMPDFAAAVEKMENSSRGKSELSMEQQVAKWQKMVLDTDPGLKGGSTGWQSASFDDSKWKTMALPAAWEEQGLPDFDGVVWFRKTINVPDSWAGKSLKLNLGVIDDNDITYVNGEKIGETVGYGNERSYTVPADQVKAGPMTIVVRVTDTGGGGGLYGNGILDAISEGGQKQSLSGDWIYHIGVDFKKIAPNPVNSEGPNRPTVLYNAMIHPFLQFAIKGAIWYQGESNADRAHQYRSLFPNMIKDWRKQWNEPDFPFYYVQLANFMNESTQPEASAWAELRDAQKQTLELANTGMATIIDIGEAGDIHPKNKQEVGRRLALIALAKDYGQKITYSGPVLKSQKVNGNSITLTFSAADGGLVAKGGAPLQGFTIAGKDQKFYIAEAHIKGNQVILQNENVPAPVAVRYAWANNPVCNLYNAADLPASPFKTDNWADITLGKK